MTSPTLCVRRNVEVAAAAWRGAQMNEPLLTLSPPREPVLAINSICGYHCKWLATIMPLSLFIRLDWALC